MGTQKEHITQNANEDGYFFLLRGLKIFVTHPPVGSIQYTTGAGKMEKDIRAILILCRHIHTYVSPVDVKINRLREDLEKFLLLYVEDI